MKILSHRGWWLTEEEKNTPIAFERSFKSGFGLETDVRDAGGRLVIAHNPPTGGEMELEDLLKMHQEIDPSLPLAINIKSDGLCETLRDLMNTYKVPNWFAFDMSVPDMLAYNKFGCRFFTRHSDIEPDPSLYPQAEGVWVDQFQTDWLDQQTLKNHVDNGKKLCLVSPELHRRDPEPHWQRLLSYDLAQWSDSLMLCTDFPDKASAFFNER